MQTRTQTKSQWLGVTGTVCDIGAKDNKNGMYRLLSKGGKEKKSCSINICLESCCSSTVASDIWGDLLFDFSHQQTVNCIENTKI